MALKKKGSKRRVVTVDMEGVESGGKIVPDGTYEGIIESVESKESSNDNPMLVVKWKLTSGKGKGGAVWDNLPLVPQALWRLKGLLEALGVEVPDSSMDIDLTELEGQEASLQIVNENFEGKDRPKVTNYGSPGEADADEGESEEEEEEEEEDKPVKKPAKKKASKKPAKDEDEEEEEEEEDDEDEEEDEEEEEDEKPAKKKTTSKSKISKFKEGDKVSFKDEDDKTIRGIILEVDGDTIKVEDKGGTEWELESSEVKAL